MYPIYTMEVQVACDFKAGCLMSAPAAQARWDPVTTMQPTSGLRSNGRRMGETAVTILLWLPQNYFLSKVFNSFNRPGPLTCTCIRNSSGLPSSTRSHISNHNCAASICFSASDTSIWAAANARNSLICSFCNLNNGSNTSLAFSICLSRTNILACATLANR